MFVLLRETAHPPHDFAGTFCLGIDGFKPVLHLAAVTVALQDALAGRAIHGNGGQRLVDLMGNLGGHFTHAGEAGNMGQFKHAPAVATFGFLDQGDVIDHHVKAAHLALGRPVREIGDRQVVHSRTLRSQLTLEGHRFPGQCPFDVGEDGLIGGLPQQFPHGFAVNFIGLQAQ